MNKQVIILFGAPGAGKGTQAELLADKLSLYYFETSKILEQSFQGAEEVLGDKRFIEEDGERYDILNEKKLWLEGMLCDPPFVVYLVRKKIKELFEEGKNLVMAGSPRSIYEAEKIIPILKELYGSENVRVILIDISPEETMFRNSHRRLCQLMRHPILYNEETKDLNICPLDGSKLIRRKGLDDPETIKIRLKEYEERTYPVLEIFEKEGLKVNKINGEQTVADVFEDILKAINRE
jgi:adenylate kinase